MKVILTETVGSLGVIGSEVVVADGYARNYLIPQSKAVEATASNRKRLEQDKAKFDIQIAKEKEFAEEMAKRLEGVNVRIGVKVSDQDRLYGSVTVKNIIDALAAKDIEVDKRMVLLKEPIKSLGTYNVPIRVYKGVKPEVIVEVHPEA